LGAGVPKCDETTGDAGGFRISLDDGKSLLPNATTLRPLAYTWALDIDPRNPKVLLQLHQGGLFRSTDAGCSFTALPNVPAGAWDKLVRAPSRPELWVLASVFESRMAWTADDGATWTVEQLPDDVMHLAIDSGDDGVIGPGPGPFPLIGSAPGEPLAAPLHAGSRIVAQEDPDPAFHWTFAGRRPFLYTRTATDQKWEQKPIPLPDGQSVISAVHAPKRLPDGGTRWLVGASTRGLWRSDDGGGTWSETNEGLFGDVGEPPTAVTAVVPAWISVAPSDSEVVYAVLNQVAFAEGRDAGGRGIWRSDDGAATWSRVVEDGQAPDEGAPGGVPERVTITGGTRVFVAPDDPRRAYFAHGNYFQGYGTDLFRSTDGLESLAASHFDDFYEIFDLAFGPQGSAVLFVAASSDIPTD
jgi:photosystem II stability/assembly factor-like uncharacterized protein